MRRETRERGASQVAVIVLVVITVGALACVLMQCRGKGASGGGASDPMAAKERTFFCVGCKKVFETSMTDQEFMPLQMTGVRVQKGIKCAHCGQEKGVPGIKCASCGEVAPHPGGMVLASGRPVPCVHCKKPVQGTGEAGGEE